VNGKMPSQDLSTWIGEKLSLPVTDVPSNLIPPLKEISPLSMDGLIVNPLFKKGVDLSLADGNVRGSLSELAQWRLKVQIKADQSDFRTTQVILSRPTALSAYTKIEPVDKGHPEDVDLIVLGFQELDLSTEALLYSTTTLREDAWTSAALAALGEKGDRYDKVRISKSADDQIT
jgi:inositol polyphosphate 5-phosphatase INPP5B/F